MSEQTRAIEQELIAQAFIRIDKKEQESKDEKRFFEGTFLSGIAWDFDRDPLDTIISDVLEEAGYASDEQVYDVLVSALRDAIEHRYRPIYSAHELEELNKAAILLAGEDAKIWSIRCDKMAAQVFKMQLLLADTVNLMVENHVSDEEIRSRIKAALQIDPNQIIKEGE